MFVGYQTPVEAPTMKEPNRAVPIVFDYVELRLRLPVRRPDDPFMTEAGITLPISRVL